MNCEDSSTLFLPLIVLLVGLTTQNAMAQSTTIVLVEPRSTFRLAANYDSPTLPTVVDLSAAGIQAGDLIELDQTAPAPGYSYFSCGGSFTTGPLPVSAVFSASDTVLADHTLLTRVPDAIDVGIDRYTGPIAGNPTDIPEDFFLKETASIVVPPGATHFIASSGDSYYADNCVPANISAELPRGAIIVTLTKAIVHVGVDVKPGSFPNSINLGSMGATPVAILGSASLDVDDIDTATLTLGTSGVKTVGKTDRTLCSVADVSGDFTGGPEGAPDGFNDLVCHFVTMSIVPEDGDSQANLLGALLNGTLIEGSDSVNIVP